MRPQVHLYEDPESCSEEGSGFAGVVLIANVHYHLKWLHDKYLLSIFTANYVILGNCALCW